MSCSHCLRDSEAGSGPNAPLGSDQERGGAVAVDEIKTLLGRPLVWVPRDDKNDPGEAAKQAEQLVSNDRVDMLTGCVSAATTLAINQVAKRAGLIQQDEETRHRRRFHLTFAQPLNLQVLADRFKAVSRYCLWVEPRPGASDRD